MSNYLSNLAAIVVHPGGEVHPRLPGRFEPQHPALPGLVDFEPSDDAELTSPSDADRYEPAPPAKPAPSSGDLAVSAAHAPEPGKRPHDRSAPAISPSPPVAGSQPPASQSRPQRSAAARPEAEPGTPAVSERVAPAVQPPTEPPSPAILMPDTSTVSASREELRPSEERRPASPPSAERQPARSQPPAAAPAALPEIRPTSAPEPSAPVRPAVLNSGPFAPRETSRIDTSAASHHQIEPTAPSAGTASAAPQAAQKPSAEPILGRVDGRPAVEPHVVEPLADAPSHRARTELAPTIRVTIGRIEIRATLPPASPPRTQPVRRQPALPLAQYLQRRNEGKQ
jgi:hypothetical protein